MRVICIWADGTWCDHEDIEDYSWMSDDYVRVEVSWDLEEDDVEYLVQQILN